MLPRAQCDRDARRSHELSGMPLSIGHRQGIRFKTLLAGNRQAGCGIKPTREKHNSARRRHDWMNMVD
jgi:hypothetical protein